MDRSENMRHIRSRDSKPEMMVRRLVYNLGYRYRLHRADLPGKPDMVFVSQRKVIFVHGCFWHAHGCKLSHVPKTNVGYWSPKLERNRARDAEQAAALRALGWKRFIVWECDLGRPEKLRQRVVKFLQ